MQDLIGKRVENEYSKEALMKQLADLSGDERKIFLEDIIKQELAVILHVSDYRTIDVSAGFFDLGIDSLMAIEFKNRLQNLFGESLPMATQVVFDYPSVVDLTSYLLVQQGEKDSLIVSRGSYSVIELKDREKVILD